MYRFGRDTLPGGGVIRWNGIGIGTPVGTPVKAVEGGRVALVQRLSTYGLTVILEHGNGYYSVYSQLATATVAAGAQSREGGVDRNGGWSEYRLRTAPALRDPRGEPDRAGSRRTGFVDGGSIEHE